MEKRTRLKPRRQDEILWGSVTSRGWGDVLGGTSEMWGRRRWGWRDTIIRGYAKSQYLQGGDK